MRNAIRRFCHFLIVPLFIVFMIIAASTQSAATSPPSPPTISVSVVSSLVYTDSITFEIVINRNGKTIDDYALKYSLDGQATWQIKKGVTLSDLNGIVKYRVVVANLPPKQTIHYQAYLVYNSGATTLSTDIAVMQTRALPEINITISQLDSESVTFSIVFVANGNELETKTFESRLLGGEWIPHTTDTDNMMVGHMGLLPGTTIQYHGSVTYKAGGNVIKELRTADASASTNLLPVITVSVIALDYESMTVQADIDTNGNTVTNSGLVYKYNDTPYTITFDETHRVSSNRYSVVIPGLPAEELIQVRGSLTYLVYSFQSGDIPRDLQGDIQSVWTKKPPEYRIVPSNVDFDHVAFSMIVIANGNPIERTVFEHRLNTNAAWSSETETGGSSWDQTISVGSGYTTAFYRGYLVCQTGVAKREFPVEEQLVDIYMIQTKASWYQWYYNKTAKRGDLEVFGSILAYKVSADDISYLDKGFVWSENPEPVLTKNQIVSLGAEDLPDETVVLSAKIRDIPIGRTIYYRAYAVSENGTVYYGHVERFDAFAVDVLVYTPTPTPDSRQGTTQTSTSTTTSQGSATSEQVTPAATTAAGEVTPVPATVSPQPTSAATESQDSTTTDSSPTNGSDQTGPGTEKPTDQQETAATNKDNLSPAADRQAGSALPWNKPWLWLAVPVVLILAAGGPYYFVWRKRHKQQN